MPALAWLLNLGFAGGTEAQAPAELGDLTTLFAGYVDTLKDANPTRTDSTTLVHDDLPTVIAGTTERADRNTQYAEYLS